MNYKPITIRAKCNYSKAPANQEVTIDPQGKTPVNMAKVSPLKKPLVGNQDRLPQHLQKKILASPAKKKGCKSPAKKYKSPAKKHCY
jgi:BRCT domain type II-containing protein